MIGAFASALSASQRLGSAFGHCLNGHGSDEIDRLAEVRLEEQVGAGELIDREPRLNGHGHDVRRLRTFLFS